jgi:hypothetical protein
MDVSWANIPKVAAWLAHGHSMGPMFAGKPLSVRVESFDLEGKASVDSDEIFKGFQAFSP